MDDFYRNVNDVTFKIKFIRSILSNKVLDAKRPFGKPSELVDEFKPIVHEVTVHMLLSETATESTDSKLADSWKSAIDDWNNRILELIASDVSDKSLAGVWLLGLTCRECSSNRFLASHVEWLNQLLELIQSSASSQRVKRASCAAISDLMTRLAGFKTGKDGTIYARKVIQPVVKLLNDDDAMAVWETAAHLLSTIIHFFPSSAHHHYDSVESAVLSRMLTVNSSAKLLKKLAFCLALLPKLRGDEDLMLKRVLVSINILLDDALEGLDGESNHRKAVSILLPQGSSPLGEISNKVAGRSTQLLMRLIRTLMQCFCMMLSGLYHVQVTLPVHAVLATIKRVLDVDGSVSKTLEHLATTMQQEVVCAQLPMLHQYSLEVLTALVTGLDCQLLPYAADIARILISYLKKYTFPETRVQVYSIIRSLLVTFGAGIESYLAEVVTMNASVDLKDPSDSSERVSSKVNSLSSAKSIFKNCSKKRNRANADDTNNLEVEVTKESNEYLKPIAVKIAALKALEAILRAGHLNNTADKSNQKEDDNMQRTKIDDLVFTTAMNVCKRWAVAENTKESKATWADFQLAALDALLASLLAPSRVRPAHLSQGLKLFRNGSQLGGPKIAETCTRALLSLELLFHPRALPLGDFSSPQMNQFSGLSAKTFENNDFLNNIHMERDEDHQVPAFKSRKTQNDDEQQLQVSEDQIIDNPSATNYSVSAKQVREQESIVSETPGSSDKMMIDFEVNEELPNEKQQDPVSREGVTVFPPVSGSSVVNIESRKAAASKDQSSADLLVRTETNSKNDISMKLSKEDHDNDSDWSLSSVELDQGSDGEEDSASH